MVSHAMRQPALRALRQPFGLVAGGEARRRRWFRRFARLPGKIVDRTLSTPGAEALGAHIQLAYFGGMAYR
jgi:hypothetical protein